MFLVVSASWTCVTKLPSAPLPMMMRGSCTRSANALQAIVLLLLRPAVKIVRCSALLAVATQPRWSV